MEMGMATHSSTLAWRILWTEEPDGLQSMRSQRVGHDWATFTFSRVSSFIFSCCCSSVLSLSICTQGLWSFRIFSPLLFTGGILFSSPSYMDIFLNKTKWRERKGDMYLDYSLDQFSYNYMFLYPIPLLTLNSLRAEKLAYSSLCSQCYPSLLHALGNFMFEELYVYFFCKLKR